MGLFGKIKNILFDEEEVEIPINDKSNKTINDEKKPPVIDNKKAEIPTKVNYDTDEPSSPSGRVNTLQSLLDNDDFLEKSDKAFLERDEDLVPRIKENDVPKIEPSFHFPIDFNEDDYKEEPPVKQVKTNTVTIEKEKLPNYDKYIITKKEETIVEKRDFKASPIISPVYGIMDKNYKKEDIFEKPSRSLTREQQKSVDLDAIRKKAFGTLEDDIESTINSSIADFYSNQPASKASNRELEKLDEELTQPIKTIDELLMDSTSDEPVNENKAIFEKASNLNETFKLDEVINEMKKTSNKLSSDEDLFKLIDSMYEEREDDK